MANIDTIKVDNTNYDINDKYSFQYRGAATEDLDNIIVTGEYLINGTPPANTPENTRWCKLLVFSGKTTSGSTAGTAPYLQVVIKDAVMFTRIKYGSPLVWTAWKKYAEPSVSGTTLTLAKMV